jgi:hypothetical protein
MSDSVEPVSVLPARFTLVLHEGREKAFFSFFCRENDLSSKEQHQYLLYDILRFLRTNKNNIEQHSQFNYS